MIKYKKLIFCLIFFIFQSFAIEANNIWSIDKGLSEIKFELPILFGDNIEGKFTEFDGNVIIDQKNNKNNIRAVFYVQINSLELNKDKYKKILLSDGFFDAIHFPIAIIDTKKFTTINLSYILDINSELQIKDIIQDIPFTIIIKELGHDFIQVKADIEISRSSFKLGKDSLSSILFFGDKVLLKINIFLNRE